LSAYAAPLSEGKESGFIEDLPAGKFGECPTNELVDRELVKCTCRAIRIDVPTAIIRQDHRFECAIEHGSQKLLFATEPILCCRK
jgi:hypothetical protein